MGFSDALGGSFGWMGSQIGQQATQGEKQQILDYLKQQMGDAQGLTPNVGENDPAIRAAQLKALSQFGSLASSGGMDPQAIAMQAQGQRDAAGYEKSQRGAILADSQARGAYGGADIAAQLSSQQQGANRSAMVGQQAASDARMRALQAMSDYGSLASGIRGQDVGESQAKWNAGLQKYGAVKDARQGMSNYYAADRAETIGNLAAGGQSLGNQYGAAGDAGLSYATGGLGGGQKKASGNTYDGVDYDYFNKLYGKP